MITEVLCRYWGGFAGLFCYSVRTAHLKSYRTTRNQVTATRPGNRQHPWLNVYSSNWPGVGEVFRLERRRKANGKATVEVVYGIISLGTLAAEAGARLGY